MLLLAESSQQCSMSLECRDALFWLIVATGHTVA